MARAAIRLNGKMRYHPLLSFPTVYQGQRYVCHEDRRAGRRCMFCRPLARQT